MVKMNLSRAAKKFRVQMPQEPEAPKEARAKKKAQTPPTPVPLPVPEPVVETVTPREPVPEPVVPAEVVQPAPVSSAPSKKGWRVKTKRPRFVREGAENRERTTVPALPPRSTKLVARLLTKNLSLLPKDEPLKSGR